MAETTVSTTPLIVTANRAMYTELKRLQWTIDVVRVSPGGVDNWAVKQLSVRNAKIFAGVDLTDVAGFSHELLHVKKFEEGHQFYPYWLTFWNACGDCPPVPYRDPMYVSYMNEVNNVMMHEIMLDEFLQMGFNVNQFIYDYDKDFETINEHGNFDLINGGDITFRNLCDFVFLCCKINFQLSFFFILLPSFYIPICSFHNIKSFFNIC